MDSHTLPAAAGFPFHKMVDSAEQTGQLGGSVASMLSGGEVILLYGSLGAGKTCFVQGLCAALKVRQEVVSPTFTLVNTYTGGLKVHHLDFYRLEDGHSLSDVGVPELLDEVWDRQAVLLVEWPGPLLPELAAGPPRLELLAEATDNPDQRTWHLRGVPEVPVPWATLFTPKKEVSPEKEDLC